MAFLPLRILHRLGSSGRSYASFHARKCALARPASVNLSNFKVSYRWYSEASKDVISDESTRNVRSKRRSGPKPPQDYTSLVVPPDEIKISPIGFVRSPYKERFGTPRQATVVTQVTGGGAVEAEIHLIKGLNLDKAVSGLEGFEYIWVLSWMHLNRGWNPMVTPPRGPRVKRGVLATRAPHRPNPIALSALRLVAVEGLVLRVHGIDLLDGTPVLDVKPYVPYCDSFPTAAAGWLDELQEPLQGPDLLKYGPPPPPFLPTFDAEGNLVASASESESESESGRDRGDPT